MPVDIRGKNYWTVAERLKLAMGDAEPPVGIQSITTAVEAVGNLAVCRAVVVFKDGRSYSGHSMLNTSATSPAERDAPLETAETSALGRALAFAGYFGSPEGIAGAEEIHLAQQRAAAREQRGYQADSRDVGTAAPRPVRYADGSSPSTRLGGAGQATQKQIDFATRLLQERQQTPPDDLTTMSSAEVSALIDRLRGG
jgi:hypothetical protein